MRSKRVALCFGLVFLIGCGGRPAPELPELPELPDAPEQIIIFSMDGNYVNRLSVERDRELAQDQPPKGEKLKVQKPALDMLYDWPVLGKMEVAGAERQNVVVSIRNAIRKGSDLGGMCFNPRHMVRIVKNGTTTDVLICFECRGYLLFKDGQEVSVRRQEMTEGPSQTISPEAQEYFDKLLTDASVPLAPKW